MDNSCSYLLIRLKTLVWLVAGLQTSGQETLVDRIIPSRANRWTQTGRDRTMLEGLKTGACICPYLSKYSRIDCTSQLVVPKLSQNVENFLPFILFVILVADGFFDRLVKMSFDKPCYVLPEEWIFSIVLITIFFVTLSTGMPRKIVLVWYMAVIFLGKF